MSCSSCRHPQALSPNTKNYKAAVVPAFAPCSSSPCNGTSPLSDWTFEKGVVEVKKESSTTIEVEIRLEGVLDGAGDRCNDSDDLTFRVTVERTANLDGAPQTGQTVYTKTTTPSCEAYPNDSDLNAGMSISVGYWDFVEIRAIELEDPSGDVLAIPGITYNTIDPYP